MANEVDVEVFDGFFSNDDGSYYFDSKKQDYEDVIQCSPKSTPRDQPMNFIELGMSNTSPKESIKSGVSSNRNRFIARVRENEPDRRRNTMQLKKSRPDFPLPLKAIVD